MQISFKINLWQTIQNITQTPFATEKVLIAEMSVHSHVRSPLSISFSRTFIFQSQLAQKDAVDFCF